MDTEVLLLVRQLVGKAAAVGGFGLKVCGRAFAVGGTEGGDAGGVGGAGGEVDGHVEGGGEGESAGAQGGEEGEGWDVHGWMRVVSFVFVNVCFVGLEGCCGGLDVRRIVFICLTDVRKVCCDEDWKK